MAGAAGTADGVRGQTQPVVGATGIGDPYYPTLGNGGYDARHYTLDLAVDVAHKTHRRHRDHGARWPLQDLARFSLDLAGFMCQA